MEGIYRSSKLLKNNSNYRQIVEEIYSQKIRFGMSCLAEIKDNLSMWAYYAGDCKGICIKYSTKKLIAGLGEGVRILKLSYVDEAPILLKKHADSTEDAAVRILSHKLYNWSHEREWRVLGLPGPVEIDGQQPIDSIYLGLRISDGHRRRIVSSVQGSGIKLLQMFVGEMGCFFKKIESH